MDTNNTVKSQNQPAKKKHGPIYYIITVIGWIFGILVIGGLVYNNFFNNQQDLPLEAYSFTTSQIEQVDKYSVIEFANKTTGNDNMDGDWVVLTDIYYYTGIDDDLNIAYATGTDLESLAVIQFFNHENLAEFLINVEYDNMIALGKCAYDTETQMTYLTGAVLLNADYSFAVPSEFIENSNDETSSSISGEDPLLEFLNNPIRFEETYTGKYITATNFEIYTIEEDEVTAILYVDDTVLYLACDVDRTTAASLDSSQRYNITGCVGSINSTLREIELSDCTFTPAS